jgi:hypothetical protein
MNRFYCVAASLMFGLLSGTAWFAALMPVGMVGAVGYDLSRYVFALAALVAFVCLLFRPWRQYGLGVFIAGLLLGIGCWPGLVPISLQPNRQLMFAILLFGLPLGITVLSSAAFLLACRRSDRRNCSGAEWQGPAAAPRRFGMGTLVFVVVAASVFFAIAKQLDMPPPLSLLAGSFLSIIGGLQMLMNRVPRAASVGAGAVLLPLTLAATWTTSGAASHPLLAIRTGTFPDIIFVGAHLAILGAACGYVGGTLVAGLFLVIELVGGRSETNEPRVAGNSE